MDVNIATGRTLRFGVVIGLATLLAGLLTEAFSHDAGISVIRVGLAVIIFTPMVSIVVSATAFYLEKDYRWFGWVMLLFMITLAGLAVSYFY